jgi:SAM-dependent methyltransferase
LRKAHVLKLGGMDASVNRRPTFPGYDREAQFYDYCWSSFVDDIAFYRKRLGRPGRVLDLMCGTGRVGIALARAGWDVDGVDQSREMLDVARSKASSLPSRVRGRVRFHRSHLNGFRLPGGFDGAVIPVNSLPLILTRRDRVSALRNVRRHLKGSGKLLLNIDTPISYDSARTGAPHVEVFRLDGGKRWYVRSLAESFVRNDLVRGLTTHVVVNRSGRVETSVTSETRTRVLSVPEVLRELRAAGFAQTRLFGDYDGKPLTKKSNCAVFEARV